MATHGLKWRWLPSLLPWLAVPVVSLWLLDAILQVDILRRERIDDIAHVRIATLERYARGEPVYVVPATAFIEAGLIPVAHIPGEIRDCYGDRAVSYAVDQHGFRNPASVWTQPGWKVAIVGDSLVEGVCVEDDQTIAAHVARVFAPTVNLNIAGASPLEELAVLREYAARFRPQVVVWAYYEGNDLVDSTDNPLRTYLNSSTYTQDLLQQGARITQIATLNNQAAALLRLRLSSIATEGVRPVEDDLSRLLAQERRLVWRDRIVAHVRSWIGLNEVRSRLKLTSLRGKSLPNQPANSVFRDFAATLSQAKDTTQSWGGTLIFVYLPAPSRFTSSKAARAHDADRAVVRAIAADLGLPIVDMSEVLRERPDPAMFFSRSDSVHFNADGYRLTASEIVAAIQSAGLLPAR